MYKAVHYLVLWWLYHHSLQKSWNGFTHIIQGCCTGIGAIDFLSDSEVTQKDMSKIDYYLNTTKCNTSWTLRNSFDVMYRENSPKVSLTAE